MRKESVLKEVGGVVHIIGEAKIVGVRVWIMTCGVVVHWIMMMHAGSHMLGCEHWVIVQWGCDVLGCDVLGCDVLGCDVLGCDVLGCGAVMFGLVCTCLAFN